jgi:LuxR family quorum-sensing system transcriptional regulator SolR
VPIKAFSDMFLELERATTSAELRAVVEKLTRQMGFEKFVFALTIRTPSIRPQEYTLAGYPPGWVKRYIDGDYFKIDPIVRHAQTSTLPIVWTAENSEQKEVRDFWQEASAFGLAAGLTLSVHEQPGITGIFSVARDKALDLEGQDLAALIGHAQMLASVLHHAVFRIELPKLLLPEGNTILTARERECLKWAADGKTAWEIAQILGITERTAVFHVNNVVQKLGASNKTQAIVRALALNLL